MNFSKILKYLFALIYSYIIFFFSIYILSGFLLINNITPKFELIKQYQRIFYHHGGLKQIWQSNKECIEFDEDLISYELLVDEFWKCHDPTTLDRQGPDVGRQYRSVIYYYNDTQKNIANNSKDRHQESFQNNIVTEISHVDVFYKAEEYHQKYILKGNSCAI